MSALVIGVPTEIKDNENRVSMQPDGVAELVHHGHQVVVQAGAGKGSRFDDAEFAAAGAKIVATADEVFAAADLIVKVKEPVPAEYHRFREGQQLFTYLHLAADRRLTEFLLDRRIDSIAYETVQTADGKLPLLTPMSEVAGRLSVQEGAYHLGKAHGGRGILLSGVPGVPPGNVVILGAGTVGLNALRMAVGLGGDVSVLDVNVDRLRHVDDLYRGQVVTVVSNAFNIARLAQRADLLVGAVLVAGARAPVLVPESMVKTMKEGSVIVDVAVDQGGCVETMHPTTLADPIYLVHGVVHYGVANMPALVPRTSTFALTNVTLPYILELGGKGVVAALRGNPALAKGLNVCQGRIVHPAVAESVGENATPLESVLA